MEEIMTRMLANYKMYQPLNLLILVVESFDTRSCCYWGCYMDADENLTSIVVLSLRPTPSDGFVWYQEHRREFEPRQLVSDYSMKNPRLRLRLIEWLESLSSYS